MSGRRGQGRPQSFTPEARATFLAAVAAGTFLGQAATLVGICRRLPFQHAAADPEFASALRAAKAAGKTARAESLPCGERRYNEQGCRGQRCTAAASLARTQRRARAASAKDADDTAPADGPKSLTPFSLRVSSVQPARTAA